MHCDVCIVQHVIAPYKVCVFEALAARFLGQMKVVYLARIAANRQWSTDLAGTSFSYQVIFEGVFEDANPFWLAARLYTHLRRASPSIVVVGGFNYLVYWVAWIWAQLNAKKLILINESHYLDRPRVWWKEAMKSVFVRRCDAALVDGTRHKAYTERLGLNSQRIFIKLGTGPIDVERYRSQSQKFKLDKERWCELLGLAPRNFLFVGRFASEKNLFTLLRAFKRVQSVASGWGLILVGTGPLFSDVARYIEMNQISDVHMAGYKEGSELELFYGLSDVFVLPSTSEPWGLVVNEAMASGLPVIASRACGCVPDLVRDGITGATFEPDDEDELVEKMSRLSQMERERQEIGVRAYFAVSGYTADAAAAAYAAAFHFVHKSERAV